MAAYLMEIIKKIFTRWYCWSEGVLTERAAVVGIEWLHWPRPRHLASPASPGPRPPSRCKTDTGHWKWDHRGGAWCVAVGGTPTRETDSTSRVSVARTCYHVMGRWDLLVTALEKKRKIALDQGRIGCFTILKPLKKKAPWIFMSHLQNVFRGIRYS